MPFSVGFHPINRGKVLFCPNFIYFHPVKLTQFQNHWRSGPFSQFGSHTDLQKKKIQSAGFGILMIFVKNF